MIVEAMKQALEAMELEMKGYAAKHDRLMPAAHAIRAAIAEAEKLVSRQWVGFTEAEINEYDYEHRDFIYEIEDLLKKKNIG